MPAWIECRDCGVEFRDKPGRTRCPECGARVPDEDDDWDDERPRRRPKAKAKPTNKALVFSLIGVGVLAVGLVAVLVLLFVGGPKKDPSKVTVANFTKVRSGMTQRDTEKVLAGSASSSIQDIQTELSRVSNPQQAFVESALLSSLTAFGSGEWRRWDGVNSDVIVWGFFSTPWGGRREQLSYGLALEKLPGGGHRRHTVGSPLGGFPFPNVPMPNVPNPQFPPFPK